MEAYDGYFHTFGNSDGDPVMRYILDKLKEMDTKQSRKGYKWLGDITMMKGELEKMGNRTFVIYVSILLKQNMKERAKALGYHVRLEQRFLNVLKRTFTDPINGVMKAKPKKAAPKKKAPSNISPKLRKFLRDPNATLY